MRRINFKLLLMLGLAVFLVAGIGVALWYFNSGRAAGVYLEQAQKAEKAGDLRKAFAPYLQYLAFQPADQETKEHTALLAAEIAQLDDATFIEKRRAYRHLTRLLRHQPERNDLRRRLVDVLVVQNAYIDAKKQVDQLVARDIVDPELDYIYANGCGALGEYEDAIDGVGSLIGFNKVLDPQFDIRQARAPDMLKAYLLFAAVHRERGEGKKDEQLADKAIERMVQVNPDSARAFLIRGNYLRETNSAGSMEKRRERRKHAKESLQKALELDGEDIDILLANAGLARQEKNYVLALEYLERAQQISPEDEQIYIDQAVTSRQNRNFKEGVAYLKKGFEILPENTTLVMELFTAHLAADQVDEARALIEVMQKMRIASEYIDLSEARLLMFEQRWSSALIRFADLRPRMLAVSESSVAEIDALMARCYQNLGQWDQQLSTSRRLLGAFPRSPAGLQAQAGSLMSLEKYDEALKVFGRLRRQIGSEEFFEDPTLRDSYMQLLSELGKQTPRYLQELRRIQAGIYESENVEAIDKAMIEIRALVAAGKEQDALDRITVSLVEHPDSEDLQDLYLAILIKVSGPSETLTFLDKATTREENRWKDREKLLSARIDLIAAIGGFDAVSKLKALEPTILAYDLEEQVSLWLSLSRAHFSLLRSLQEVNHCLSEARKLSPKNRKVAELLFETALLRNNEKLLLAALQHTEEIFGRQSDLWNFQRARYLVWGSGEQADELDWLEEVEFLIEKIEEIRPRWHRLLQLKALIAEEKNDKDEAIENYQRSLEFGPMDLQIAERLTNLLINEGRIAETLDVMDRLEVVPVSMIKTQGLLYALSGKKEQALQTLDTIKWDQVTNVTNWIWRSRMLKYLGEDQAAEKALFRAVELDSNDVNSTRALIDFFAENRSPLLTFRHMQDAENRLSESPEMQALLADLYNRFASYAPPILNEHYLCRAIAASPTNVGVQTKYINFCLDNKRLDSAIAHLSEILEQHISPEKKNEPIAVWARQTLARVLSSQPNHQAFQQALGLIEANRVGGQLSQYDKRLKGFLLVQRDEPLYRQHGVRLLETVPDHALKRREILALAELYFISDRWRECKTLMERLNTQYPEDIDLLSRYCEMLFERGDKTQARTWLRRLNQVAPESLPALKLKALNAKLQGQFALSQFKKLMLDSFSKKDRRTVVAKRLRLGKVFESADLFDAAEDQYRQAAAQDKTFRFELASFLARQGETQEAVQLCREIATKNNIRTICTLIFNAILSQPQKVPAADMQQLSEWIELAKGEHPDDWKIRTQEAFLLDLGGKTAEAIVLLDEMKWEKLSEYERGMVANNRAYFNLKLGKNDEAVSSDLEIAFEYLGPKIELLDTRAMALIEQNQFDAAVRDLSQATIFEPSSGRYHFHLALAHQGRDDRVAAREALQLAQAIGLSQKVMEPSEKSKYETLQSWLEN